MNKYTVKARYTVDIYVDVEAVSEENARDRFLSDETVSERVKEQLREASGNSDVADFEVAEVFLNTASEEFDEIEDAYRQMREVIYAREAESEKKVWEETLDRLKKGRV